MTVSGVEGEATVQRSTPWVVWRTAPSMRRCAQPVVSVNMRSSPMASAGAWAGMVVGVTDVESVGSGEAAGG